MLDALINLIDQTHRFGAWSMVVLGVLTFFGALLFVPRTPTSLAAGLVFGIWSAPVVLVSATAGSALMFWAVRHGLEQRVRKWISRRPTLQLIVTAIDKNHWRLLALLRFWGPVPASVQNCVFALTSIDMPRFVIVSLVFGAPQAFAYAYIGSLGRSVIQAGPSPMAALFSGLAAVACVLAAGTLIGIRVRAELDQVRAARNPAS